MWSGSVFAPGRVNLIGEHTDYSKGLVLPAAVSFGVTVTGAAAADHIRLRSLALPGAVEIDLEGAPRSALPDWGRYAAAAAQLLAERGRPPVGLEGTIDSTVPIGAGLASSAALIVAVALALCQAAEFDLPRLELARLAQQAEQLAVGVPSGLMDPAASLLARRDHALLLDCGTEDWRLVRLPAELAIVALDSAVRHSLEHSDYGARRDELERALPSLDGRRPADLSTQHAVAAALAAGVDDVAARRLRHVVSENERVRELVDVFEAPVVDRERVGAIMDASHRSLRDDFEVSTPELDLLVTLANEHGAVGARLTGGGFGGSVVALVDRSRAQSFATTVAGAYRSRTGRTGSGWVCTTVDGAGEIEGDRA